MKINLDALEVARQRSKMTRAAFASELGISARDMRRIREKNMVDPEFIARVASMTGFPEAFFLNDHDLTISRPTFRKQATLSAKERDSGEAAAKIAKLLWKQVESEYSLPEPDVPDYSDSESSLPDGVDRPVYAAMMLRQEWGLGSEPIGNIITLLERHGIKILSLSEEGARGLSAFTFWGAGQKPFIYLNMISSSERTRFDAAHELAHLVLHRRQDASDEAIEREADRFASAFLVPKNDLIAHKCFPTLSNLRLNKRRWRVSLAALVRAYRDNGLIDETRYSYLNIEISRNGWKRSEPDQSPRDKSGIWAEIKKDLWSKGQTVEDLARRASVPVPDAIVFTAFGGANSEAVTIKADGKTNLRLVS